MANTILLAVVLFIGAFLAEVGARLCVKLALGTPFLAPAITAYYPELKNYVRRPLPRREDRMAVLLLGGSVLTAKDGFIPYYLNLKLQRLVGKGRFEVVNLAREAHGSRDSLLKYQWLEASRFDLVIFYHAVNETRANNCPAEVWRDDYSHYSWYADVNALSRHRGLAGFWLSSLGLLAWNRLAGLGREQVPAHHPKESWLEHGGEIKSAGPFRDNLTEIARLSGERGAALILGTFAYFLPAGYTREAFERAGLAYQAHSFAVELWGRPGNVVKGIETHNRIIREVAARRGLPLVEVADGFRGKNQYFDDIVHLSPEGSQAWVEMMTPAILAAMQADPRLAKLLAAQREEPADGARRGAALPAGPRFPPDHPEDR